MTVSSYQTHSDRHRPTPVCIITCFFQTVKYKTGYFFIYLQKNLKNPAFFLEIVEKKEKAAHFCNVS